MIHKFYQFISAYDPHILRAKKACRPDERHISITPSDAKVTMQSLCEKEVSRIMEIPGMHERILHLLDENGGPLELEYIFKHGCDGTRSDCFWLLEI